MLLSVKNISKHFGGLAALSDISFAIEPGQIFGLIGPNGAGKTTLFTCLPGVYRPTAGLFAFADQDITGFSEVNVAKMGVARTFQNIRLFKEMTALENVMVGRHPRTGAGLWGAVTCDKRTRAEFRLSSAGAHLPRNISATPWLASATARLWRIVRERC